MNNNFTTTFTNFLKSHNVKVTKATAEKYVETHPDYPSMLAYADALDAWKVENAAIQITSEQLLEIPTPFITFSHRNGGTFSVIRNVADNIIERLDTETGWVKDKIEDFLPDWSGVVMLAEPNELSGENDYETKRRTERLQALRLPLAFTLLGVIILATFVFNAATLSIYSVLLGITKTALAIITTLLLIKSIDTNNAFVNKLCNAGTKISCQSILESNAAKLTEWLSWSDVGFIYAVGSLIGLLLSLSSPAYFDGFIFLTLITSGLGALFSIYSVYYQGVIAKIWCPLCLGVVALFWAELVLAGSYIIVNGFAFTNATSMLLLSGISFLIPVAFLLIYKTTAAKAVEKDILQLQLDRLKRNPNVLNAILNEEALCPEIPPTLPTITIGSKESKNIITFVSNPLCSPCAQIHYKLEKLLKENKSFKCQIIFYSKADRENAGGQFVRKLFSLPEKLHQEALNLWFEENSRNYEKWNKGFLEYDESSSSLLKQKQLINWVNDNEIRATPTLFFNGRRLNGSINLEDLISYVQ
jgi:uncharacterized membrane protein